MWILDAAPESLVENIKQTIKHKHLLIAAVRKNLENLQAEVEKLHLLMKDFTVVGYSFDSDHGNETLKLLRELLDEAEDTVDSTCLLKADSSHLKSTRIRSFTSFHMKPRDQMLEIGAKIERICRKVNGFNDRINEMTAGFAVQERPQKVSMLHHQAESSSMAPKVDEDRVIGFDGIAEKVVALITRGPKCLEVISVVGMYGLGKTALARMVYNDPEVNSEYAIRAFVSVSGYDKKEVITNILNSFTHSDDNVIRRMSVKELKKHVFQQLREKQYLVVLDNLSDLYDWERLKDAFPNNRANRCRVLITTRNLELPDIVSKSHPGSIHGMESLSFKTSLELFRWRVFGENDCPVKLREYEEEIVRACAGLPLTIIAVAAMVVIQQKHIDGWKDVASSMKDYVAMDEKTTSYVHAQIYVRLPNHLKSCFVYLAAFPQDFEIHARKLLQLWIAEGLIHSSNDDLEYIAEGYLEELVDRNLLMVSKRRSNGRIGICRMHGMIYEFCKEEASREMLVPKILIHGRYDRRLSVSGGSSLDQYRHICIENVDILSLLPVPGEGKCARSSRSLLYFSKSKEMVLSTLKTFKYPKVLEAESLSFTSFPNQLCTLILLKYLAISGSIQSLPSALLDLWNLQTLIVNTIRDTLEIKADVWKMPNFRHLHTNAAASFPFLSTKGQESQDDENNVQTLCYISPGSCKKEISDHTSKLKKLGIRGDRCGLNNLFEGNYGGTGEPSFFSYMHKFECLENLKLWNDHSNPNNKLSSLPPSGAFPKQLKKLTLWQTRLEWKEMRTLGEMENLEILKLKKEAFVGEKWKTENGGFFRLRHLHIGHTDLMVWETSADHFPILRSLEIRGCDGLLRVPHSLADILSLQSVRLHSSTGPGVTYSLKRIRLIKFLQTKQADKRKIFEITVFSPQL